MHTKALALLLGLAAFGARGQAAEVDLNAGGAVTVDGTLVTCEKDQVPVQTWSCAITCTISGFQDASDVVRPMAGTDTGSGTALNGVLQSCGALEQAYVTAFKQQHPTWPIYIDWAATCGGQAAGIRNCCAQDR